MDKSAQDITYFVSFCIELYKHKHCIKGMEAMQTLDTFGVLKYLADNYEVLHTQSSAWLMEEMEEYIQLRKKEAELC